MASRLPKNPLLISGISEITLAVYLGWVIAGMNGNRLGPFKHRTLVLKGHIDYIMMGTIQIALSATAFSKRIDPRILWPFMGACWLNASLFLVGAVAEKGREIYSHPVVEKVTLLSFTVKTVSWTYMMVKAVQEGFAE
ncbi:hypothetical protein M427DRAFT_135938 [Gonapodya prolifera JEL478]|uniref:Uncharacterized protein n=1 Tax=Gonapodya prolifera (strain JEL478) TaxID=1344416 RepID=A0A139AD50_GONPJ|nr:hypothetical protein M427DRAFT_135938 [Gonapodya prolifera JEL478]|eukprot:KXS14343.1 hypothetical protein M427DRAFT_135938 [Gonapodya prolifera JEL478]